MFTPQDINQLHAHGISESAAEAQMTRFRTGFPYLKLSGSAAAGNGITVLSPEAEAEAVERWQKYLADGGDVAKFVPASGAASRMFKALFAFVNGSDDTAPAGSPVAQLLAGLDRLPLSMNLTKPAGAYTTPRPAHCSKPDARKTSSRR